MSEQSSEGSSYVSILLTPKKCYPAISTSFTTDRSPSKSPSKRGILFDSLTRTPNGRSGTPLPRKVQPDVNKSARKRARQTISSKLFDEDDYYDDPLGYQDRKISKIIVSDLIHTVGHEEDLTIDPSEVEDDDEDEVEEEGEDESDVSISSDEDAKPLSDDEIPDAVEDDLDLEIDALTTRIGREPKSRQSPRKTKLKRKNTEVRHQESTRSRSSSPETNLSKSQSPELSPTRRSVNGEKKPKIGRRTKAELVSGTVRSIFDEKLPDLSVKSFVVPKTMSDFEKNVYKKTNESIRIPTISGVVKVKNLDAEPLKETKAFPLPKVDKNGNIDDEAFLQKYFQGKKLDMEQTGTIADSRAVFMEGADGYFEQHSIRGKVNHNSLAQNALSIEYDQFNKYTAISQSILHEPKEKLHNLHRFLYNQWCFELSQGYNLNFFGIGSKIKIMREFVENYFMDWYYQVYREEVNVIVINGFNPNLKFKNVFSDIVECFFTKDKRREEKINIPSLANEAGPFLKQLLDDWRDKVKFKKLLLLIHNIDGDAMRDDKVQNILAQLATIPEIWIASSVDHLNAPLIWDLYRMKSFNFLWHDLTTYDNYEAELKFKDVLAMGRSKKFVGDKGAKFVLSSLTLNARKLYKVLLDLQLESLKEKMKGKSNRSNIKGNLKFGIDFKTLYNACLEDFITSNEINFRTVLREFVEHKMCSLANDETGAEKVFIPFNVDEMEKLSAEEFQDTL